MTELVKFVTTITGLDLADLGLVDDDGVGPFDNVTNLSLSMGNLSLEQESDADNNNQSGPERHPDHFFRRRHRAQRRG